MTDILPSAADLDMFALRCAGRIVILEKTHKPNMHLIKKKKKRKRGRGNVPKEKKEKERDSGRLRAFYTSLFVMGRPMAASQRRC